MKLQPLKIGKHTIEFPIIQGGMGVGVSWDQLAGNVSKEGGLGVISSVGTAYYKFPMYAGKLTKNDRPNSLNFNSPEALKEIFRQARIICGKNPLATNIMYALSGFEENVKSACEAGADIIISGAGMPLSLPKLTMEYPDVALVPIIRDVKVLNIFIKKWGRLGRLPDAVVLEGPKSGGHQGFDFDECELPENQLEETVTPVVELANKHGIPVIVAGGIWDHNDIEKFISMGASGVQVGTRFVATYECDTSFSHKQALLDCEKEDISLKKSPVGFPSRSITTNLHELMIEGEAPRVSCSSNCVKPRHRGEEATKIGYCIADRLGDNYLNIPETGLFFTGTNGYKVKEIISVHDLMQKLIHGE
jgi:nitronate monooxygenase